MNSTDKMGRVWLVGAGPGNRGMMTLKGTEVLKIADVVVYDALVSADILCMIPDEARAIAVGKRAAHHLAEQEEINRILLAEALAGHEVVRLKGGDPFVFGRGGEELELLVKYGVPFEIVPGVTSAVAVPAYAGIPITHRDYSSSFHVITGHTRADGNNEINYKALAQMDATLVFLMGLGNLPDICENLIQCGMPGVTPAAVLEKGGTPHQRRVVATLETITEKAKEAKMQTPAMIVVGGVCTLSTMFGWVEKRPLSGQQILVTRPLQHQSATASRLRWLGAGVLEMPTIRTQLRPSNDAFLKDIVERGSYSEEWFVFTSPVGVDFFFELLVTNHIDLRKVFLPGREIKFAVIGSATKEKLENHGFIPDLMPEVFCGESLGQLLAKRSAPDSMIRLFRSEQGSPDVLIPLKLKKRMVKNYPIYATLYETSQFLNQKVSQMLDHDEIDMVMFTSASTVRGFVKAVHCADYGRIRAMCIGRQTAAEAKKAGMQVLVSKEATISSLIELAVEQAAVFRENKKGTTIHVSE